MAQPDLEDVIDATKTLFQSQFPANLQAVDARKSTPLQPLAPREWIFGDRKNQPQLPSLVFTGHETAQQDDEYQWRNQTYRLQIEGYYTLDDLEKLSRIMRRYGAAIDDTLRQNNTLGGIARNVSNISQQYWDTISSQTGLFQVVRVTFDVTVITD